MENSFRFLINVDQCLNMSYFDIFFYRLKNEHKFYMSNAQLFGDQADSSMSSAIHSIRLYLDKYPYHVGDYQIIVVMRNTFQPDPSGWEETLLYRMLLLDRELRQSRIYVNAKDGVDKALNLIMLYDADFCEDLSGIQRYMESDRLERDCDQLLSRLTAGDCTLSEQSIADNLSKSGPAEELLHAFLEHRRKNDANLEHLHAHMEADSLEQEPLRRELARFVKEHLCNFQLFEKQIDRNNRRQNTLALLRLVDFINHDTADCARFNKTTSLTQRCVDNWEQVWKDEQLEQRYALALRRYRGRLTNASREINRSGFSTGDKQNPPIRDIPADDAISYEQNGIFGEDADDNSTDLRKILSAFYENRFSIRTLKSSWEKTYEQCKLTLNNLDYALQEYAENLSRQFSAALEQSKQTFSANRSKVFIANADTEKEISHMARERDKRLDALKSPHMTPSLTFQDQLNMKNALEQGNRTIRFYAGCISAMKVMGFLLLVLFCGVLCFGHYTFLQPYVFQSPEGFLCWLSYLGIIFVMMLLCWMMPYHYFRRKIRNCIKKLQDDAEKYIKGYYDKAKYFHAYINLLNQLDFINRQHRLLTRAYDTSNRLTKGYQWHVVQINNHLQKLYFFQGLIDQCSSADGNAMEPIQLVTDGDRICDVVDSPLYWPEC